MGKATRRKQEQEAALERKIEERLSARGAESGKSVRGVVRAADVITPQMRWNLSRSIRKLHDWTYPGKSRRQDRQRLDLVRYLFGKYPVPRFLENVMIEDTDRELAPKWFSSWYICAAQGGSLYKECTRGTLSKKETHWFLQAPDDIDAIQAIWWAKSMALVEDVGLAGRMARSVVAVRGDYTDEFWIDVHRFFVNNPVTLTEMQELADYIMAEHRDNENWTIKKRSLDAIRRKSEEWHRLQVKMRSIGGGSWEGYGGSKDWTLSMGKFDPDPSKNQRIDWYFTEIREGNKLVKEGQAMRHCVGSYKRTCMEGRTAIFSMHSVTPTGARRNLTIEVIMPAKTVYGGTSGGRIVQARGLANRLPRPQESTVLRKWATAQHLQVQAWGV